MLLSRFPQDVADVREALKSVTMAMNEPVSMSASDLLESAMSNFGQGSDEAKDIEYELLGKL